MKNIVLIGMRGSGKTRIGRLISQKLKIDFIDLDREIEKKEARSISEIVKQEGWEYFRKVEAEVTKLNSEKSNTVISTGGGIILNPENIKNLAKNGTIIFLYSDIENLKERIARSKNRPSLTGKSPTDELKQVWLERKEKYYRAAEHVINVSKQSSDKNQDVEDKAKQIIKLLKN